MSAMKKSDVVAVLGLGPIGQLVARVARVFGAGTIYATEVSQARCNVAIDEVDEVINASEIDPVERILQLTNGKGADIVFECAGSVATSQQSLALVRKGGTIIVVGICYDWVAIPFSTIMLKELTIKGSICFAEGEYATAFEFIKNGSIKVDQLITHKISLDNINEAFEMASRGEGVKIMIKP